jgi:hypothetical protein
MNILKGIVTDLRQRRLWIVAVALVIALVAIPVALSKKASPTPIAQVPASGAPASLSTGGPAVTVEGTPSQSHLSGKGRNPFTPQAASGNSGNTSNTPGSGATAGASAGAIGAIGAAAGGETGAIGTGTGTGTGVGSTGGGSPSVSSPPPATGPVTGPSPSPSPAPSPSPGPAPAPQPAGLRDTQSYRVALSITNASGGLNRIDSLERLSLVPSQSDPMLVELGVLKGGHRVLFAVQPGTVVRGPGSCTPGPIDCEVLSLAPNQVENVSEQVPSGTNSTAQFAVTAIGVDNHPTVAAASRARREASAAGAKLLDHSTLNTLSLFQYQPSIGAVLDLRNLTVGGN